MHLDEGDKAVMREIAYGAAKEVGTQMRETTMLEFAALRKDNETARREQAAAIEKHGLECPIRKQVEAGTNRAQGALWLAAKVVAVGSAILALLFEIMRH